ncbi:acetyltransferase [Klebsiella pneumoniae]|uniref:acyltransferase family protein n=1 Tax=Klebsiella variicola TaxID=244366 RepID=UPI0010347D44|nr:acyltransferase family protein [Klebsiella variicola]EIW9264068.1 acetyltransferase [Klebsiella pneumoniae]
MKIKTFESYDWVDAAKGIGIILVVAGHTLDEKISNMIFLFHMPFFFLLGGYLYSPKPVSPYFINKTRRLIIPYIKYLAFFTTFLIAESLYKGNNLYSVANIILRSIYGGQLLSGATGVFWFVTVFFFTQQALNYLINKIGFKYTGLIAIISLCMSYVVSHILHHPSPFNITVSLQAFPFMYIGYVIKTTKPDIKPIFYFLLGAISIWFYIGHQNQMIFDMKASEYGIPFVSFAVALILSACMILISEVFKSKALNSIGKNSMSIMFIHQFFNFYVAEKITSNQSIIFLTTLALSIAYCVAVNLLQSLSFKRQIPEE